MTTMTVKMRNGYTYTTSQKNLTIANMIAKNMRAVYGDEVTITIENNAD